MAKRNHSMEEMTMRDYFAGLAMQVILKDHYEEGIYIGDLDNDSENFIAGQAYVMADAMLKARNAQG